MVPKVAVLIVSGFLGSGKTTLVRRLLEDGQRRGLRVGVISNEFGELGIDAALLGDGEQRFVELAGGCICCELSDELVETMELIRQRTDPHRIIIETSGVALPFETQLNLYRPPVSAWVGDEAVIVVVDASALDDSLIHGTPHPAQQTFEDQISAADLLILHKTDLVPPARIPALRAHLHALHAEAPVLCASHGDIDPELLFPADPRPRDDHGGSHDHGHDHDHHGHDHHAEHFTSTELRPPDGLGAEELLTWLRPFHTLRSKGFVRTTEGVKILQGVGRRLELTDPGDLRIDPSMIGRVVTIHRSRDQTE